MLTIILGCVTGLVFAGALSLAWPGHPVWATVAGLIGFMTTMVGINFAMRRRLEAVFKDVQAHMTGYQEELRRRIAMMQNKNISGGKGLQKRLEKDQEKSIREAIEMLDRVEPMKKWNILAERQTNTLRGQLYYQIKDFENAKTYFSKSLVPTPDPVTLAMKMGLMYRDDRMEDMEKAFRRGVKRFKDEKGTLIYGVWSWALVQKDRIDDAIVVLDEGKSKTENETIRQNWEHLVNGRIRRFSNAGLGDQWYALHLETPKAGKRRRGKFGTKIRRR